LGVASGDRPEEYPALNHTFADRGARFRESFAYIRHMSDKNPMFENLYGSTDGGIDMLPKPEAGKLPMLITGGSQQDHEWIAEHGDGWMTYPRNLVDQTQFVQHWQAQLEAVGAQPKPVMQSLYIDLAEDPTTQPAPIHLGFRSGVHYLRGYLKSLEEIGMHHVALNLRFNQLPVESTLQRLADELLSDFT